MQTKLRDTNLEVQWGEFAGAGWQRHALNHTMWHFAKVPHHFHEHDILALRRVHFDQRTLEYLNGQRLYKTTRNWKK
jgi:hypothetical protein